MDREKYIKLEFRIIEGLQGRMNLLQPQKEREENVREVLAAVLAGGEFTELKQALENPETHTRFVRDFLSYGIVTDLLCDFCVEDLIINNLKPIYIHHSQKGFISTGKRFASREELDAVVGPKVAQAVIDHFADR